MNQETSVYLDAIRFSAALSVFFSHVGTRFFAGGFLWQCGWLGEPAVVIFFVLSGFVIGYAAERRETSARDYVIARGARLYSVVIPTLLITACLDWTGSRINPAGYVYYGHLIGEGGLYLPVILTFLQNTWLFNGVSVGSDGPYWSLGYEVIYYVIFGVCFYARGAPRVVGFIAVCALAGPRVVGLFPLWLLGLGAWRLSARYRFDRRLSWAVFIASLAAAVMYGHLSNVSVGLSGHQPMEIAQDDCLGVIFAINLVSFVNISEAFRPLARLVGRPVRWLAGATFTLYLLHYPLLVFVRALAPWPRESWEYRIVLIGLPLCVIFIVARYTERRKDVWRRGIDRLLPVWLWPAPAVRT